MKNIVIKKLIDIANKLDKIGMYKEASEIDKMLEGEDLEALVENPINSESIWTGILRSKLDGFARKHGIEGEPEYRLEKVNVYGDDRDPVNQHVFIYDIGDYDPYDETGWVESVGNSFLRDAEFSCPNRLSFGDSKLYIDKGRYGREIKARVEYIEAY